jgi:primosomal protein N'
MTSVGSSADGLSGPVGVCVDRPLLSLDRPFTYDLPEELGARVGTLVQVPFHGRASRGWILGPIDDLPKRMLAVKKVVSPVSFFDERRLALFRWVSERYVAPSRR